jgi:hypothetical protein
MKRLLGAIALASCTVEPAAPAVDSTDSSLTKRATNTIFATEWGPTRFNAAGHPDGYDDCGPTSLLMAAAYLGYYPAATAATAEADIRHMRDLTRGAPTNASSGTPTPMMLTGIAALGARGRNDTATIDKVNAVLDAGGIVILGGDPKFAWGEALDDRGDYLHHYSGAADDVFDHWVAVLGYSSTGWYVIADPLSTIGAIDVRADQIEAFWSDSGTLDGSSPAGGAIAME